MKMVKNWKKEIARDIIALGSIPFYLLVIIRAIIGEYAVFVYQLIIALIVLIVLSLILKNSNQHIARGFIVVSFTSLFYKAPLYTTFAFLTWAGMVLSSKYLKIKNKEIFKGIAIGIISTLASYWLVLLI